MKILIVGGTSGLGLALAREFKSRGDEVIITGRRKKPEVEFRWRHLDIGAGTQQLAINIEQLFWPTYDYDALSKARIMVDEALPTIDLFIFAAGFLEKGTITETDFYEKLTMMNVGLFAPIFFVERLLIRQQQLKGMIIITSTSQWTPRYAEPLYTATKGGLGMLASSLSLDPRIEKTLVAAPSGMNTAFWDGVPEKNKAGFLTPQWVAEHIIALWQKEYRYCFGKFLGGGTPRVEIVETRK